MKTYLFGLTTGILISALVAWTPFLLRTTAILSCQDAAGGGQKPYCVYYDEKPALFSHTYRLTIGREAGRGVVYIVPFSRDHIQTNWKTASGDLTITMPGSTITVSPSQYIDHR